MVDADGPAERLRDLCCAATTELVMAGAVVMLRSPSGPDVLAATSTPAAERWAGLEFDLGEGPALQALERGRPVLVGDLLGVEGADWPGYAASALEAGLRAVFALPLLVGASKFGVLTLFGDQPRRLDDAQRTRAYAFADTVTRVLLDSTTSSPSAGVLSRGLEDSLTFRSEVYQAQGMTMVSLGGTLLEALARMRAHAFATERGLDAVARDIVDGQLVLRPDPHPDPVDHPKDPTP